ncbi:MAG: Asp-tRNA(Asn)/Glu-tRNA(Gln) amidotransferase subunit GatC [Candidatus Eisenbacteria bacterium]|nr:Asp-tRNA(Asn)/Glu-tRNA(Gln) amidotransferase subunit GatC [Candidatus Eisenbacteria bacterium]
MGVSGTEVEHVAQLARLDLSTEEVESLTSELNRILEYFERLSEADTEGVEPAFSALRGRDVFRPDEPDAMLTQEEALANAPRRRGGYFVVPAFLPDE